MRIRFTVAYDGTGYCGWQKQKHSRIPSLQEVMEAALTKLFREPVELSASGRTDSGVHANAQVCHFDVSDKHREKLETVWDLRWALRGVLPQGIVVKELFFAPDDFHATISATHKTYRFLIYNNPVPSPFWQYRAQWIRHPIDIEHLKASMTHILGYHDFKSFQSAGTEIRTTDRRVLKAEWRWRSKKLLEFSITGEGFLKQMVRNLVGTMLLLEKDGRSPHEMKDILEALDRRRAGAPADPWGLYLMRVYYPRELDKKCRPLYTSKSSKRSQQ